MDEDFAGWSDPAVASQPKPAAPALPRVWGPWATVGWTILEALCVLATQLVVAIGFLVARMVAHPKADPKTILNDLAADGNLIAVATLVSLPVVLGLLWLLTWVRGWRLGDYLALQPASTRATVLAVSGLILWLAASDGLTLALGRPLVPTIMVEVTNSAPLWLISLAVVVVAPIVEEAVFRGFCYRGLAASPSLGPGFAIGITALGWAAMHVQYDLYGIATIYLMGLYLGVVRYLSGSTSLTILLHGIANTIATAEAVYFPGPG